MRKKLLVALLCIMTCVCLFISWVFASSAKVKVLKIDSNGAVISVKSDEKIKKVIMYKKDAKGNYVRFFENIEDGYNEKNFFISKYSLSQNDKTSLRIDVVTENGQTNTEDIDIDKLPGTSPTQSPTPSVAPSTTPTATIPGSPSITPTATMPGSPSITSPATAPGSPSVTPTVTAPGSPSNRPTSISLNQKNLTLTIGEKKQEQLKLTIQPSNAQTKLTWSTKNKNIATVDKNGLVVGKKTGTTTITVKTDNGLVAECKVTVKIKKISGTIGKSNSTLWSIVNTVNGCTSMQSVAVTDKYYICAKRNNNDTNGTLLVYDKKTKKRVNVLTGNFGHANGATYNSDDGYVYVTHMGGRKVSKISTNNLTSKTLKRSIVKFPVTPAGIAYDKYTQQWVFKSGKNVSIYNKDLTKKVRSFTVAWHTGQDCEVYNGLLLSIDYVGSSNAYVYVYNITSGECYGRYKITLPVELESLAYDKDNDCFIMVFNDNGGDKLYRTKAINLKKYY